MVAIESGGLLDILAHPNQSKYPRQRVLVVSCDNYAYLVSFRDCLNQGEPDAEN